MNLKNLVATAIMAGSLLATSAFGGVVITLNPSAGNGALPTIDTSATPRGAFDTDNAVLAHSSFLDVATTSGTGKDFSESGNFYISSFALGNAPVSPSSEVNSIPGPPSHYSLYAAFQVIGKGDWNLAGTIFTVTSITSLGVGLYAAPTGSTFSLGDPLTGSAVTFADFGITQGLGDITLGFSSILVDPTNEANAKESSGGKATTNLVALLDFTPASSDLTGVDGFFQKPDPFKITIGSNASGNVQNTFFCLAGGSDPNCATLGAGERFYNINHTGSGTLSFGAAVPEPNVLALIGLAFAGMGFLGYRRRSDG